MFPSIFSVNEFLGCMSFGIRHLTNPKKEVSGWYYLLTEDIGRKKHLQVSQRLKPQLQVRNNGKHHMSLRTVFQCDRKKRNINGTHFSLSVDKQVRKRKRKMFKMNNALKTFHQVF